MSAAAYPPRFGARIEAARSALVVELGVQERDERGLLLATYLRELRKRLTHVEAGFRVVGATEARVRHALVVVQAVEDVTGRLRDARAGSLLVRARRVAGDLADISVLARDDATLPAVSLAWLDDLVADVHAVLVDLAGPVSPEARVHARLVLEIASRAVAHLRGV